MIHHFNMAHKLDWFSNEMIPAHRVNPTGYAAYAFLLLLDFFSVLV